MEQDRDRARAGAVPRVGVRVGGAGPRCRVPFGRRCARPPQAGACATRRNKSETCTPPFCAGRRRASKGSWSDVSQGTRRRARLPPGVAPDADRPEVGSPARDRPEAGPPPTTGFPRTGARRESRTAEWWAMPTLRLQLGAAGFHELGRRLDTRSIVLLNVSFQLPVASFQPENGGTRPFQRGPGCMRGRPLEDSIARGNVEVKLI